MNCDILCNEVIISIFRYTEYFVSNKLMNKKEVLKSGGRKNILGIL